MTLTRDAFQAAGVRDRIPSERVSSVFVLPIMTRSHDSQRAERDVSVCQHLFDPSEGHDRSYHVLFVWN